jgi:hypothetical protein
MRVILLVGGLGFSGVNMLTEGVKGVVRRPLALHVGGVML